MATVYRIAKFNDVFVKRDGKKDSGALRWVSTPIGFASGGYQAMVEDFGDEAASIYGAWSALVNIAAQCSTPGVLCSSRGRAITPERAAAIAYMPAEPFRKLFAWAVAEDVGWLEVVSSAADRPEAVRGTSGQPSGECPGDRPDKPTEPPGLHNKTEHNTTEQDKDPSGSCAADAASDPELSRRSEERDRFLTAWGSASGVRECRKLTPKRAKALAARCRDTVAIDSGDVPWLEALERAAKSKFPLPCTRGSPDAWTPDADWILRPDSLQAVFEGKYDWSKRSGNTPTIGAGQRHDGRATTAAADGFG